MTTFLYRRQLIFKMNTGCTCFNHAFHQLVRIQHAAKAGFGISHDGCEVIDIAIAPGPLDLVSTSEGIVDPAHHGRDRVDRIQGLIGIHGLGCIAIGSNLPTGKINGFYSGLDLLHCLTAGNSAQAIDIIFLVDQFPQFFRTTTRQCMFFLYRATQTNDIFRAIVPCYVLPARIVCPVLL